MTKRFLNILLLIFTTQLLYSQEWHKQEYRELNFPSSIYYTQYIEYEYNKAKSKSNNKSFVLDIAKVELSKKIISEVQGESNLSTIRKGAVYNSIFNSNSKISTSATFVDLQVLESINKKKSIHILIYIKKNDFKILTKSRYEDLLNSIIGEVNACNQMYSDKSFTEAKVQGDFIELEIKKLKRLKNLLSVFNIDYDPIRHNSIIETFQPLYAKIKKHISDEQNYRYNKEQGDLKALSNNYLELEQAIISYKKSERINSKLALEDRIPDKITNISVELFKIYCQKALNYEQESKYYDAVNFYDKARNLFSGRKVVNEKETTTDRIIICQDKLIDILISQGVEEFDDNPNTALTNFKKAKDLITSMNRNDRIKEINKLLKKAKKEIKKRKNKEEKTSRKGRVKTIRGKSPHRVLFSIGGGFQNEYTNPNDIFSNAIKVDVDKWHISTTLGYRLNLPTEMTTSKTGFEKTKGNVLALFYKQGNTETNFEDNNFQSNFREIEFGYIFKERIRVSLGKGNRSIHVDYIDQLPSNYNCATGSWYMHFGRLSVETSVTYLLDEKFALEKAKLNANFSLRFYLYQKIYKKIKEKI
tara:strand:- start:196 stop:1959 length:1764 start_codon:yes stop_codon:yes gene_type:complete